MKIITTNSGNKIKVYSSSKEMPSIRYAYFQKYLISDIGLEFLFETTKKAKAFVQEFKNEEAEIEITNIEQCANQLILGIGVLSRPFAIMVYEIDGEKQNDFTEDGLNLIIQKLEEFEVGQYEIESAVEELKKKIQSELSLLYPDIQDSISELAYNSRLKRYILRLCDTYSQNEIPSNEEVLELRSEKNWFLIKDKPKNIETLSLEIERNFLSLFAQLELNKDSTILDFYSKIDYLNKKNEKELEYASKH